MESEYINLYDETHNTHIVYLDSQFTHLIVQIHLLKSTHLFARTHSPESTHLFVQTHCPKYTHL